MADELVNVASFEFLAEAESAQMRLEAEGITAFVADATLVTMDWFLANAVGYIKLQVPASQAELALEILDQPTSLGSEADSDHDLCLQCGSTLAPQQTSCPACGWSYAGEDESPSAIEPEEATDDQRSATSTTMQSLRKTRRLIMLLIMWPLFFFLGAWLAGLVKLILHPLR